MAALKLGEINYFDNLESKIHKFFGKDTATSVTVEKKKVHRLF